MSENPMVAAFGEIIEKAAEAAASKVAQQLAADADARGVERQYLSAKAVSALISVSVPQLSLWRQQGEGPPIVVLGRKILYKRADLFSWLDARRRGADPARPSRKRAAP